jgi:uncharacterized membrane-anchored protein
MIYLQAVTGVIDHTIPLWGLISSTVACIIFIVNMHITIRELKTRLVLAEGRIEEGDNELKSMNGKIKDMSEILVKVDTKLDIYFKMHEKEDRKQ